MQFIFQLFAITSFLFHLTGNMHEFHMSKGQLVYDVQEKAWQLSLHLYVDDLEESMKNTGIDIKNIATDKEPVETDSLIQVYLNKHFVLKNDDVTLPFTVLGKENGDELLGLWIYAEIENSELPQNISLDQKLMIETFSDQQNMLQLKVGQFKEVILFNKKKTSKSWTL